MTLLRLPEDVQLHYKTFRRALNDNSTTHRAKRFTYADQKSVAVPEREASMSLNRLSNIPEAKVPAKAKAIEARSKQGKQQMKPMPEGISNSLLEQRMARLQT